MAATVTTTIHIRWTAIFSKKPGNFFLPNTRHRFEEKRIITVMCGLQA